MRCAEATHGSDRPPGSYQHIDRLGGASQATEGDDILLGTKGPDFLAGLAGNDTILALRGNDTVYGDAENGPWPPLGAGTPDPDVPLPGNNLILAGGGDDDVTAGWGADIVFGGAGDDLITGYGGGFVSPGGFDAFLRREGADLLSGDAGNDTLLGGGGADTLLGGKGADHLTGGYGADLLIGGRGADLFIYAPQDPFGTSSDSPAGDGNRDVILDFGRGDDRIDLSAYQTRFGGGQPAHFLGTDDFEAVPGLQIRFDIEDGRTVIQFTTRGGSGMLPIAPTGEIELIGVHHLTIGDFLLA